MYGPKGISPIAGNQSPEKQVAPSYLALFCFCTKDFSGGRTLPKKQTQGVLLQTHVTDCPCCLPSFFSRVDKHQHLRRIRLRLKVAPSAAALIALGHQLQGSRGCSTITRSHSLEKVSMAKVHASLERSLIGLIVPTGKLGMVAPAEFQASLATEFKSSPGYTGEGM